MPALFYFWWSIVLINDLPHAALGEVHHAHFAEMDMHDMLNIRHPKAQSNEIIFWGYCFFTALFSFPLPYLTDLLFLSRRYRQRHMQKIAIQQRLEP